MEQLKFKTNINCGGCIEKVTPFLNGDANIKSWEVDTVNPKKILTVDTESLSPNQIIDLLKTAGFRAEAV